MSGQPDPVSQTAAAWALRQDQGEMTEADERRFAAWLDQDPAHLAAYDDVLWGLDAAVRHAGAAEMQALRTAALSARKPRRTPFVWAGGAVAAAAAGLVFWTVTSHPGPIQGVPASGAQDPRAAVYATAIGGRSAITLPDGSVATLDTDSQIRIAYGASERGVYLLKGQALFDVAHGKATPFQVYAKGQRIRAVGTRFNVRIEGAEVRVSMAEGRVTVSPVPSPGRETAPPGDERTLVAGEALVAGPTRPSVVRAVDVRQVASWKGGVLVFNDTPLSDAVAEINRYTLRPIAIADTAVGSYRVSGVFKTNDPERFSTAMADLFPIEVTHASNGAPTLRARAD
jgi:transmembrane sensor